MSEPTTTSAQRAPRGDEMTDPEKRRRPGRFARVLTALIGHSQSWGMVWFGLIFWGSVLNAIGAEVWPDAESAVVATGAAVVGLAAGATAKVRGRWI